MAADDDPTVEQIGNTAVAYAQGFEELLKANPHEAALIGVSATDLPELRVVRVIPLYTVDDRFRESDDRRSLDRAIEPTELWWVILSSPSGGATVVTVQWASDAGTPEAVGLNWVPASVLIASFGEITDPHAKVIYLPDDAPVVVGSAGREIVAMPIATETLSARLALPREPLSVVEYTTALRIRLTEPGGAAPAGPQPPGLAGGPAGGDQTAPPPSYPLPLVVGPALVFAFFGVLRIAKTRRRGSWTR
jgi:hypothetical protein